MKSKEISDMIMDNTWLPEDVFDNRWVDGLEGPRKIAFLLFLYLIIWPIRGLLWVSIGIFKSMMSVRPVQYYRLLAKEDIYKNYYVGKPIFESDKRLVGFVYKVFPHSIDIVLFEPVPYHTIDTNNKIVVFKRKINANKFIKRLIDTTSNKDVSDFWTKYLQKQILTSFNDGVKPEQII